MGELDTRGKAMLQEDFPYWPNGIANFGTDLLQGEALFAKRANTSNLTFGHCLLIYLETLAPSESSVLLAKACTGNPLPVPEPPQRKPGWRPEPLLGGAAATGVNPLFSCLSFDAPRLGKGVNQGNQDWKPASMWREGILKHTLVDTTNL